MSATDTAVTVTTGETALVSRGAYEWLLQQHYALAAQVGLLFDRIHSFNAASGWRI